MNPHHADQRKAVRRPDRMKARQLRMTRQRKLILEELRKIKRHLSADEVYEVVRKQLPRISLGTVYRNLEVLSELGEIQKLEYGGAVKRFDWNPAQHYHIRCLECGRIDDAPIPPLAHMESRLQGITDYQIDGHHFEFVGLCPVCAEKSADYMVDKLKKIRLDADSR